MNIFQNLRSTLILSFVALPILLISFVGFAAVGLGNLGLFMLFIGQLVIIPLATGLTHLGFDSMYPVGARSTGFGQSVYKSATDIGQLVPSARISEAYVNVAPSYWMVQLVFFMTYLMSNAVAINKIPKAKRMSEWLYENRKSKSTAIMVVVVLVTLVLTALRYMTGNETAFGIFMAYVIGIGLGIGWYAFAAVCGARHADVFGISYQMLPASAKEEKPMACVYTARP